MLKDVLQAAALVFLLAFSTVSSAAAQDFYRGKTIKLVVGASATGGYNLHARTLARYYAEAYSRQSEHRCRQHAGR